MKYSWVVGVPRNWKKNYPKALFIGLTSFPYSLFMAVYSLALGMIFLVSGLCGCIKDKEDSNGL